MNTAKAFSFTELESKLLRLVLDQGASDGEVSSGATKLVRSLRARAVSPELIELALCSAGAAVPIRYSRPDYGEIKMPFGKHKGKPLAEIPPDYLDYIKNWIRGNPSAPAFHVRLADQIEEFFAQ